MSLKNWPQHERPREKLIAHGATRLSDSELLAVLLNTGTTKQNALDLSASLLNQFGGLRNLLNAKPNVFLKYKGLGYVKYCRLQAALEITKRYLAEPMLRFGAIASADAAKQFLYAKLRDLEHEVFAGIFLDQRQRILHYKTLFQGSIRQAAIYPREIIKQALAYNCASLIIAHNHPSGNTEPSQADINITQSIQTSLKLVDIELLDHIIVGDTDTYSLAEHGFLKL